MFKALKAFVYKNKQWVNLISPALLEALPISEGRTLLTDLCAFYPKTTEHQWGILLLLALLCRAELAYLLGRYSDATPVQLILLLRDGLLRGEQPRDFARQQLFEDARTESLRRAIPIPEEPIAITKPTDAVTLLDFQRAWSVLTPEEREILSLVEQGLSREAMATKLGISEKAVKERLSNARSHLRELMGREI